MFASIMKSASIAALLLGAISSRPDYQLLLGFPIFIGALVVAQQAIQTKHYVWMAIFSAMALLFNPVVPVDRPSGAMLVFMVLICTVLFTISLAALRPQPIFSLPSVTGRYRGSESL